MTKTLFCSLGLTVILTLQGCGFQPLYRGGANSGDPNSRGVLSHFAAIEIAPIPNRVGQQLHNALRDRLTPNGVPSHPRYRLTLRLQQDRADLAVQKDATSTLAKLRITADFTLTALEPSTAGAKTPGAKTPGNNAILIRGQAESTTVFNIVESQFANLSAEVDARRRTVTEISENIRTRLGIFFLAREKYPAKP